LWNRKRQRKMFHLALPYVLASCCILKEFWTWYQECRFNVEI